MAQREKDLVRIAQGTALVVARFLELRPAHSSSATAWPAAAAEYAGLAAAFAARAGSGSAGGSAQRPSARPAERQGTFSRASDVYAQSAGASAAGRSAEAAAARASEHDTAAKAHVELQQEMYPHRTLHVQTPSEGAAAAASSDDCTRRSAPATEDESPSPARTSAATADAAAAAPAAHETREPGAEARETPRQAARQRRASHVPASSLERMARFTGLGFGLAMGTVGSAASSLVQGTFRTSGGFKASVLSPGNSERLTLVLCRMRGAALKFGQLLSIQDEHVIPKDSPLRALIDRVREEAEQMPPEQVHAQLTAALGDHWRQQVAEFDASPVATASVGQVHRAVTHDGMEIALKIQYPGVADSIDADISILGTLLSPLYICMCIYVHI